METQQKPLGTGFDTNTTADEVISGLSLDGKVVIVTGGHSGLGLETTRILSNAGAKVVVGSRDVRRADAAVTDLKNVEVVHLDLASPASVDRFAETFMSADWPLDILINNAGIMAAPLTRDSRGYESQFAINHLGHFQLTARLWTALRMAKGARVVALSSLGHRWGGGC
jgi:NAD(P)-dependent dehydrogenase (short-subunit alcohol dehydrogenase family)